MIRLISAVALGVVAMAAGMPRDAAALVSVAPPVDTTFRFSVVCTDCTGLGTGTLVVQDYTPGAALTTSNFVSWSYASNLVNYSLGQGQETAFSGSIGSTPGPYNVTIDGPTYDFSSSSDGSWCVTNTDCFGSIPLDFGPLHKWSMDVASVPEPGSVGLLLAGVFGMGAFRRRHAGADAA